jgi:L-threonylcarbamoyladenylate synthase
MLKEYVEDIPEKAKILIDKFMPGPLSIILKKNEKVPDEVTAGLSTVAVRIPGNIIALELIREAGVPIAAPSANISGKPSPTIVDHVFDDLYGRVDCIIDGGPTNIGIESTVVDLTEELPILLRPGNISLSMLETEIGIVKLPENIKEVRSPGMKYKHYAPNAEVIIAEDYEEMIQLAEMFRSVGKNVGLVSDKATNDYKNTYYYETKYDLAKNLFAVFRQMDKIGIEIIIVKKVDEQGIGAAIMNRLEKSAVR